MALMYFIHGMTFYVTCVLQGRSVSFAAAIDVVPKRE
jgi:hypothetical protein